MTVDRAAAEATAVALLGAARLDDDQCARLATEVALGDVDERVLVAFCVMEACWSWAPADARSDHPVHGPVLDALRSQDAAGVRSLLVDAMTQKAAGSYAALLVQLAYATVAMVEDLEARLPARGMGLAVDPTAAGERRAGPAS